MPAGIDLTLGPWLRAVPYLYRHRFNEERLRLATRIGLVELPLSGCTTVADYHYLYQPGMDCDASAAHWRGAGSRWRRVRHAADRVLGRT